MADSTGIDAIIREFRDLTEAAILAARAGLEDGAAIIEAEAASTTAYRGMSGATRASTVAYVADDIDNGANAAQGAYNTAAGLLQGFDGHDGQPQLESVQGPGQHEIAIILTVPTDYSILLETENAGEKAFIADSLHQEAPKAFDLATRHIQDIWQ